jgi:hypothetical protein
MGVPCCEYSKYYDCYPRRVFKVQQEPVKRSGIITLNPLEKNKFDSSFKEINSSTCPGSGCPGKTYLNDDPRLVNAATGDRLQLDRPPYTHTIKLKDLDKDVSLDNYGKGYKSYKDVNAGQIVYYINREQQDAYFEPLFSKEATTVGTMYKDPMGNMRAEYTRIPNEKYDPILGDPCDVSGEYCLSWMKDTQYHREDILSKQIDDETRFAPRWT